MNYLLTRNSRADFIAYAPMHSFQGWAVHSLQGSLEIDFDVLSVRHIKVTLETSHLDTGDADRNRAMQDYFNLARNPEAGFVMTECREFCRLKNADYRIIVLGILDFAGIRRQLPITCMLGREEEKVTMDLQFKWSFRAYGLKVPRLLFLAVRDIVDIKAHLEFIQDNNVNKTLEE